MHYPQHILVKLATRAKAILDAHLRKHMYITVAIIFLLIDTLVRRIILFNCELKKIKTSK